MAIVYLDGLSSPHPTVRVVAPVVLNALTAAQLVATAFDAAGADLDGASDQEVRQVLVDAAMGYGRRADAVVDPFLDPADVDAAMARLLVMARR